MPRRVGGSFSNGNQGIGINSFPNTTNTSSSTSDHDSNGAPLRIGLAPLSITSATLTLQLGNSAMGNTGPSGVPAGVIFNETTAAPVNPCENFTVPSNNSGPYAPMMSRLRSEYERRQTFSNNNWPSGVSVRPRDLATAGFFYVGREDRVQCAFCGLVLNDWEQGEQPIEEHFRHNSTCPFVRGLNVGNIPMEVSSAATFPHAVPETQNPNVQGNTTGRENTGIYSTFGDIQGVPRQDNYFNRDDRRQSFAKWPLSSFLHPGHLADAGFFYTGIGDNVKCFFCNGGISHWEPQSDPWIEHARWYPHCNFVRQYKGDVFIQRAKGLDSSNNTPPQAQKQGSQGAQDSYYVEVRESNTRLGNTENQSTLNMSYSRRSGRRLSVAEMLSNNGRTSIVGRTPNSYWRLLRGENEAAMAAMTQGDPGLQSLNKSLAEGAGIQNTSLVQNTECERPQRKSRRLRAPHTCKICSVREVGVVFMPCCHFVACVQCGAASRNCPICEEVVMDTIESKLS